MTGAGILALFFLRLYHLTILPVFADEAIYIRWAQVMRAEETLRFLPLSDGKEPLFMWMVIPFLKFIHDPLFAGRFVSVLSGLGTLVGISYLGYLLFRSKRVAFVAGLIYVISPFAFFFDRIALVDSMLTVFGVWTFIFAYLAYTCERLDLAMVAGFMLGGAWLTKSPALFFALMLPTLWLFVKSVKSLIKVIPLTFVTLLIGYGMYNILRLGPNFHLIASRNADYVYPLGHFLVSPFDPLKPFLLQSWQWLVMMGPWTILVLGLIGLLVSWRKHWRQVLVLAVWFLGPIAVQAEFAKVFTARYILFSIPFLIILGASAFVEKRKNWLKVTVFILAFFAVQAALFDYHLLTDPAKANLPRSERSGYLEEWTAGQGIAEVAGFFTGRGHVVIGTEGYFGTLPDGLQMYLNDQPQITIIGVGINFNILPDSLVNSRSSGGETYMVINNDRFKGDAEGLGLKLLGSYPKAMRPDGTHQSLLFYQLTKP